MMGVAEKRKVLLRRSRKGEWVEDDPPGFIEYFGAVGKANQKEGRGRTKLSTQYS